MTTCQGVCNVFVEPNWREYRLFLFELDGTMSEISQDMESVLLEYVTNHLDVYVQRSMKGYHFLSPTIIPKEQWKSMMKNLKNLNPKCPMTTLRWTPNKWPNEEGIWTNGKAHYDEDRFQQNSIEMCNLLNKVFGTTFEGNKSAQPKRVQYKL